MTSTDPLPWKELLSAFQQTWNQKSSQVGVVVGCSGGADSVALVRLLDAVFRESPGKPPPLVIAHCNHRLRGDDSDRDESHVATLAERLNRTFATKRVSRTNPHADEASLRDIRRRFLVKIAQQHGCRYIALAHTADDQAETVLHNCLRGTGSAGICGMAASTPIDQDLVVRRPLLRIRRQVVREALIDLGQPWREDLSNTDLRYTRNWLRHEIMPLLRERMKGCDESLSRLSENQSQTNHLLNHLGRQWIDSFVILKSDRDRSTRIQIRPPADDIHHRTWPHGQDLARDRAVITRGLQMTFEDNQWPRGEMKQNHWRWLCDLVLQPLPAPEQNARTKSLGHLPSHLEIRLGSETIELIRAPQRNS